MNEDGRVGAIGVTGAPGLNDRMVRVDNKPREWLLVLCVAWNVPMW